MALEIPLIHDSGITQRLAVGDTAHFPDDIQVDDDALITGDLTVGGILSTGTISGYTVNSLRTVDNENAGSIVIGQPVYVKSGEADDVDLAQADDEATAMVAGLVYDTSISSGQPGDILTSGTLTATTGQWDAVTGQTGGLTPGATYYLDPSTAGRLTVTRPDDTGHFVTPVGLAFTSTDLLVRVRNAEPVEADAIVLTADLDIYVDTGGDDDTGDGSVGNPYLTIHRAAEHYVRVIPGDFSVNVNINSGVHDVDDVFSVVWPYGDALNWVGDYESVATPTISNIDGAVTNGSAPYAGLEWLEFDLDLSAADPDPVAGQFVRLTACTGGTNPQGLNGLHEIMSVASGVATCRVWRDIGTTELPSGAITVASALLLRSVLHFTSDNHGIDIRGPSDVGNWDGVVLRGNDDAVGSSKRAVRLFNGAGIRAANNVGNTGGLHVYEWQTGFEVVGAAAAYLQIGGAAKITSIAIQCDYAGVVRASGPFTFNGIVTRSLQASNGSQILAPSSIHQAVDAAALAQTGGFINLASATVHYDDGGGTAITAQDLGRVHAQSITIAGFATDYSITTGTTAADGSFINVT